MSRFDRLLIGLAAWAISCASCAPHHLVPMVLRPDTREIAFVTYDSIPLYQTATIFTSALPHEGSVCYTGELHDTVATNLDGSTSPALVLHITGVTEAVHDSVTERSYNGWNVMHIWYADAHAGCSQRTIAIAHSHPNAVPGEACTHSHDDASLVFGDTEILVSTIWCIDGRAEVLFQDGRRVQGRWAAEP